ncbi:tetratricopeptide repeat protein [Rhodovibrionaceae bacterium A322]
MEKTDVNEQTSSGNTTPEDQWPEVQQLFRASQLDKVKQLFSELTSDASDEQLGFLSNGMFQLSLEAEAQGELERALFASSCITEIWPEDFQQQLRVGNLLRELNKLDDAAALYQRVISEFPTEPGGYQGISVVFERQSKFKQAIVAAQNAIKRAPSQPALHHNLACQYRTAGQLDKAAEAFQMALKLNPYWRDSLIEYSFLLEQRGKINQAVRLLRRAQRINPSNESLPERLQQLVEKAIANRKAAEARQQTKAAQSGAL